MAGIALKQEYGLFIDGKWKLKEEKINVLNKYTQKTISQTSLTTENDVREAVESAQEALGKTFTLYERYKVLQKASEKLLENREVLAETIAMEVGKPINEARGEVTRAALTLEISAEEAKRIKGTGIPIEAAEGSENRQAFTMKVPAGVVAAITPFNVPLNLVCHKIGPALAAGNSVVLKPAEATPFSALMLAEILDESGLPKGRLNVLTGKGSRIGDWLIDNHNVNLFTFTGSPAVGKDIREKAGLRKVLLELGNNSATIIHSDADVANSASQVAQKSFNNAGQVCISVQRVFVHESIYNEFLDKVKQVTNSLVLGDPFDENTDVGPMIAEKEAVRVEEWVKEAVEQGAVLETGGKREGAFYQPTILSNVNNKMKVCHDEVFGPVLAIERYKEKEEVIYKVNDSDYGLQAGIYTNDHAFIMKAAREIQVGGLIVNDTPGYRVDHMPYGGIKKSGTGKEGPKYAIEEMMEEKLIVFNI